MAEPTSTYIQRENIILRQVAGENLLVPISGELADLERLFCLNDVGVSAWNLLTQEVSLDRLTEAIFEEFDADRSTISNDLQELLTQLLDAGLIVSDP